MKLWNYETMKLWNCETMNLWIYETMKVWNCATAKHTVHMRRTWRKYVNYETILVVPSEEKWYYNPLKNMKIYVNVESVSGNAAGRKRMDMNENYMQENCALWNC